MKVTFWWFIISVFVTGCAAKPQAASSESANGKRVYYQGTGSEHDVKRFGKFLDIALDDYGLVLVSSAANADVIVNAQFEETKETDSLYAPVLWMKFISAKGEEYIEKSCRIVSSGDDVFKKPVEEISDVKFPATWKNANGNFAIYINEAAYKDSAELVKVAVKGLTDQHYNIVKSRAEADAELKSVVLQKFSAPERTVAHSHKYEIEDKKSGRFSSGTGNLTTFLGLEESVNVKNIPCGTTMATYGNVSGFDGLWSSANDIAKSIHEHISK